jgi:hypothetical protein
MIVVTGASVSASGIDHEKRTARHRNAIEAAIRAGVGHLYYTSLFHAENSVAFVMKAHTDAEGDSSRTRDFVSRPIMPKGLEPTNPLGARDYLFLSKPGFEACAVFSPPLFV